MLFYYVPNYATICLTTAKPAKATKTYPHANHALICMYALKPQIASHHLVSYTCTHAPVGPN